MGDYTQETNAHFQTMWAQPTAVEELLFSLRTTWLPTTPSVTGSELIKDVGCEWTITINNLNRYNKQKLSLSICLWACKPMFLDVYKLL